MYSIIWVIYIIYEDKRPSFEELLEQDKSVSIHTRNLQMLAIYLVYFADVISVIIYEVIPILHCQM